MKGMMYVVYRIKQFGEVQHVEHFAVFRSEAEAGKAIAMLGSEDWTVEPVLPSSKLQVFQQRRRRLEEQDKATTLSDFMADVDICPPRVPS